MIDPTTHRTMSERSYHGATSRSLERKIAQWVHPMKDRFDDPSHHERTLLPRSYISLLGTKNSSMGSPHEGSIRRPIAPWANALTTELHLAPQTFTGCTHNLRPSFRDSLSPYTHKRMKWFSLSADISLTVQVIVSLVSATTLGVCVELTACSAEPGHKTDTCLKLWIVKCIYKQQALMEGRKEMFYLMRHSTLLIYGYVASDV